MADESPARFELERRAIARAANRAAATYDQAAWLSPLARAELMQRLQFFALEPRWIVDLGAGTCQDAQALAARYPHAQVLAIDLALNMLRAAPRRRWLRPTFARLCADAYLLPLRQQGVDLIYCSLLLQRREQMPALWSELARVLRPGGLLLCCCLGSDTLRELRAAWTAADGAPQLHLHEFPDMPQLGEALLAAGFIEPVMDVERHVRYYADSAALLRELKRSGAHNVSAGRPLGLGGRSRLEAMAARYEQQREREGLPATFELIFTAAFMGEQPRRAPTRPADGEFGVAVRDIRTHRRPPQDR